MRWCELRASIPSWGPRKLRAYLQRDTPKVDWPAASSIGDLLRREGLAHPRRKRKRTPPYTQPLQHAEAPNQVWCADFKGWFLTQDGSRCDPLTITDAYSRYLIRCCAVKRPMESTPGLCSKLPFASSDCRKRFEPTTDLRSPAERQQD